MAAGHVGSFRPASHPTGLARCALPDVSPRRTLTSWLDAAEPAPSRRLAWATARKRTSSCRTRKTSAKGKRASSARRISRLHLLAELHEREPAAARDVLHQQVHIALRARLSPGKRAEHA